MSTIRTTHVADSKYLDSGNHRLAVNLTMFGNGGKHGLCLHISNCGKYSHLLPARAACFSVEEDSNYTFEQANRLRLSLKRNYGANDPFYLLLTDALKELTRAIVATRQDSNNSSIAAGMALVALANERLYNSHALIKPDSSHLKIVMKQVLGRLDPIRALRRLSGGPRPQRQGFAAGD